jgi:hypothetical protein
VRGRHAYDGSVTDTSPPPDEVPPPSASSPGERRLAHPPSDRYRAAEAQAAAVAPDPGASVARGAAISTVVAIVGAVAIVVLGGVFAVTAGLVAVAGGLGWAVAAALGYGAGDHLPRRRRVGAAIGLAIAAVALGQLGLWQYARTEGGVLPPVEYLLEVFGPLVPLEFGAAALLAWLAAR